MTKNILLSSSSDAWVSCVLDDFDTFLADHADCERKASASAMALVVRFPERKALIEPMISLAKEELSHFHQVYRLMARRGVQVKKNEADPYVKALMKAIRYPEDEHFLDRLLVSGIIEARAYERLNLLSNHLKQLELRDFYRCLAREEAGHFAIFYRLACRFYDSATVDHRLSELVKHEDNVIATLPLRAAVH